MGENSSDEPRGNAMSKAGLGQDPKLFVSSKPPHEKQYDEDDQDDANEANATMTEAVAVAAEPAAEAAKQEDDEDDDKYES
jgi:hypothetical protein